MQAKVVSFQKHRRLSVVQILSDNHNTLEYISGPTAIKNNLIEVTEIFEEENVNNLLVFNHSDKYAFFMDGDMLIGAKQNRVLNTSVFLAPKSKTNLPVSCVQQGRWDRHYSGFKEADYIAPQKLRANKAESVNFNLKARGEIKADQAKVWDDVENYEVILNCISPTSDLNEVYDQKKNDIEAFINSLKLDPNTNGMSIFVDQKLLCTDVFNRTDIFSEYFTKILRSTAIEVAYLDDEENLLTEAEASYKSLTLFDSLESINTTIHKGVGIGEEKRFSTDELTGFELIYNNQSIHLTALQIENGKEGNLGNFRRNRIY